MGGSLPWNILRDRPGGGADRITTHPAYRLLQRRANPEMAAGIFRETLLSHALIYGNGYAEISRDKQMRPLALWLIHPSGVTVGRDSAGELGYQVTQRDGKTTLLPAANVFHLKGIGYDGVVGYSLVELAARTIGIGLAEDQFIGAFFGNGAWGGNMLEHPGKLGDDEYKRLKESVDQRHRGAHKARKLMILEGGMKMSVAGAPTNEQSELMAARRHQQLEICRFFRVPPHKIFDLERGTFSNIVEQNIEFVQDQTPWLRRLEQEADIKLISDKNPTLFTKLNATALLRGDPAKRATFYKTMHSMGAYSANRILELEDENPIGPEGNEHFIASGMRTLKDAIKQGEIQPVPPAFGGPAAPEDQEGEPVNDNEKPGVDENAELAMQEFIGDTVRRLLRKEAYAARDAVGRKPITATTGDAVTKFLERHRGDVAERIRIPMSAWLRMHGQNGRSDIDTGAIAGELAGLHVDRVAKLLGGKEAGPLELEAALLDQEEGRVEEFCGLIVARLQNAIEEVTSDVNAN